MLLTLTLALTLCGCELTDRVIGSFTRDAKPVDIEPQELHGFERKGFTLVEWGGAEVN